MNFKKKSIISSIFIILIIQILLLVNNRQRSSFRYFIWNVEEVSIGRLICISFISGFFIGSIFNKTLNNDVSSLSKNKKKENEINEDDNLLNREDSYETNEIPPERNIQDIQPTISVNYRVIKDNSENELKNRNQSLQNIQYQDDWDINDSEW